MTNVIEAEASLVRSGRDLRVYREAFDVAAVIHQKTLEFPKMEQYAMAQQMRKASQSICANLVEGFAKQSFSSAEFGRFLGMALGSSEEMQVWIEFSERFEYITTQEAAEWSDKYDQIAAMLRKLRNKVRA